MRALMKLGRLPALLALALMAVVATGCTDDPSAQFFSSHAASAQQPIDSTSSGSPDSNAIDARFLHGGIDRPDPKLTPGAIAIVDLDAICRQGKRIRGSFVMRNPAISPANQQAVLAEYNIPANRATHYGLDFLVPLQLGGANVLRNIWPVSTTHGLGFREKEILNIRLHVLVCERQMPLEQAQKAVASDWVKLWLKVG